MTPLMEMFAVGSGRQLSPNDRTISSGESAAELRIRRTSIEVEDLEDRLERMRTMCEAMWTLVCETTGLTDEHLAYKLYELDVADGRRDSKKQLLAQPCDDCGAKVNPRLKQCQFCGTAAPSRPPWDAV